MLRDYKKNLIIIYDVYGVSLISNLLLVSLGVEMNKQCWYSDLPLNNHFISFKIFAAVQTASKSLTEAIADVYESQWTGAEALNSQVSNIEVLWQDFAHKLGDQVLIPLNTYTAQFPEMKVRSNEHDVPNWK